ncbi:hypothetical protein AAFN60_17375 [Roseibacillus persicicus]|uniref:hypothetical protein n=1 Tax=Roseibacillus persicicus TaxID=454148 RepID=UPI00398B117B
MRALLTTFSLLPFLFLLSCAVSGGGYSGGGTPNMGGPTVEERKAQIATEPRGDFYYGRRYHVHKTRFWGFLRKPGQPWSSAKLVVFNEKMGKQPDRLSEMGPPGQRYGFDNNYEYRIKGYFTGEKVYEINSNQFLPEFMLTGYEQLDKDPGWLFSPRDHYDPSRITLTPRSY